ncbi:hypothetical protein ACTPEM_26515, partial [Clostridioides difficile]
KVIDKLYDSKSDVEILSDLANAMNIDDDLLKAGYEASIRHMFIFLSILARLEYFFMTFQRPCRVNL